jgi:AraC-like DNA-binding protein
MSVREIPFALTPENAVACSPWEPHFFEPGCYNQPSLFLVLYIKPIWFLEIARNPQPGLRFGQNLLYRSAKIAGYVRKITTLLLLNEETDIFDGYLYELTQECYDQSWKQSSAQSNPYAHASITDFRVRRSIKLMKERLCQPTELDKVAAESGLSRPHFYKLFRKETGITPNLFLNTLKIEHALEELSRPDSMVTVIADDLGFSSQASFTRFFASNVGLAPSVYKRVANFERAH